MLRAFKKAVSSFIPKKVFSVYHFIFAGIAMVIYRFPSRYITVIGVTGTKGKTSTTEYLNAICEEAGYKTALTNSIRMKIGEKSATSIHRMSMPGRFAMQRFLREAVDAGCTVAIMEMTSEGAAQHRHRGIAMDGLIFTNLAPEHIESHGSLEKYILAKLSLAKQLSRSPKRPRILVANKNDAVTPRFLALPLDIKKTFSLQELSSYHASDTGGYFSYNNTRFNVELPGEFSLMNALAAVTMAEAIGIPANTSARGVFKVKEILGRAQTIVNGQDFTVLVDYAHNPSSLEALYSTYAHRKMICVLGSTGGGRDVWKRPEMGKIAEQYCAEIILTNEDPYDEDPEQIVKDIQKGMQRTPMIEMDRRYAIRKALSLAKKDDVVLITGKGTDPSICGKNGTKEPWSDAEVTRSELRSVLDAHRAKTD